MTPSLRYCKETWQSLNTELVRVSLNLAQVSRVEAGVVAGTGDLNGIDLETRAEIQKLDIFPAKGAQRISIEAELNTFARLGASGGLRG